MTLAGTDYALSHGFVSFATDINDYSVIPFWDLFPNPIGYHIRKRGFGGVGMDVMMLLELWPALLFMGAIIILRVYTMRGLTSIAHRNGISERSTTRLWKFQNQSWLLLYYVLSSIIGYIVLHDKPWIGFPMVKENFMALAYDHPLIPVLSIRMYYCYEIGFYFSELYSLISGPRRRDFYEYMVHHFCTLALMFLSYCAFEHRIGSYILLLHDISDIFLALAKSLHYIHKNEVLVNGSFIIFVIFFIYMRLYCLPIHGFGVFFVGPSLRMCTIAYWVMAILLQVLLQGLHIYWFYLIIRMLYQLAMYPASGDLRSDSDEETGGNYTGKRGRGLTNGDLKKKN